ncbi:unnamed protein product [Lactuca saligna]|uniref:Uncharacterized protein n=1 Tax=Lactuca saligna TaxID=75948 RepID=A0AA35ZD19_LACSI|nr:unnamed protein product [Lactuca saligna]
MQELHIHYGVHTLFSNIGWERLLSADFATCPLLNREFLATLSEVNHEGNIAFRIFNTPHTIHVDQLCTFSIPLSPVYPSPLPLSTSIETMKVGKAELFLLWCMITRSHRPHFGDVIIKCFHRVISLRTRGAICCGGLIFIIVRVLTVPSPPGYTFFTGDSFRLTLQTLRSMHMLRPAPGEYVWMLGRSLYFKVTGPGDIALAEPISETEWVLSSNIQLPPRPRREPYAQSDRPSSSTQHPDYADATPISFTHPDPMHTDFQDQPPPTQPSQPHPNSPFTYQQLSVMTIKFPQTDFLLSKAGVSNHGVLGPLVMTPDD